MWLWKYIYIIPAIYKQSLSAFFKEKLLFHRKRSPKQKGNSRLVRATGVQPWNERATLGSAAEIQPVSVILDPSVP